MSVLMIGMKNVLARLALNKTFFFLCQRPAFGLDLDQEEKVLTKKIIERMLRGLMCSSTVVVAAIALLAQRTAAFGPGQSHWNVLYFVADDLRPEISGG